MIKGPVDVNDSITPITGKTIDSVDATQWGNQSLVQLYDQLSTLQNRRYMLLEMGKFDIVGQVDQAISNMQQIIKRAEKAHDTNRGNKKRLTGSPTAGE